MTQQLLVTIPQFSPFAFTMILMISDMEIDIHTLGSTNRRPNFCMIAICMTWKIEKQINLVTVLRFLKIVGTFVFHIDGSPGLWLMGVLR